MSFEWDESKRKVNIRKHGIDFVDAQSIFEGLTVTVEDTRFDYGETRYITLGFLRGHVLVVAHTERGEKIRIISARKATKNEAKIYFDQIAD
jgi:uncharacterized DUF497 family protein